MNLFVDANIFLDFYHFSNDDLDELKKLVDVIKKGEIALIVTVQVINEVRRNRDSKVADAYKKFRESEVNLRLPQICKSYPEFVQIKARLSDLKKLKSDLDRKLNNDINGRTLKADEIIDELFTISQVLETDSYIDQAKLRYELGNPPGKYGSYGDSLSWTALLVKLEDKKDLFFVSDDKDYKSPLNEYLMNSYLVDEWRETKNSDIFFYTSLSNFFNEHHTDIQLRVEEEKNRLIEELRNSSNFASTHYLIAELSKYISFTDEQIRDLAVIAKDNSQIFWILSDPDIKTFYEQLLEGKEGLINPDILSSLAARMRNEEDVQE